MAKLTELQGWLLQGFKALGDENRLLMLSWLAEREHNVTELAERLDVSEPTVSHHLSKLREAGFVALRTSGNQRFYRANDPTLERFKQAVQSMEKPAPSAKKQSDNRWIDALPPEFSENDRTYLRRISFDGRLTSLPPQRQTAKLDVIMRWLVTKFEPGVIYTEFEVNAILRTVHEDFAGLRRDLIDTGYLRRERGGSKYWRTPDEENPGTPPPPEIEL
ncbi:MAG: metalloregulator ArsR/SmtB family transcription factor [Anaerolineae bacterium]